MGSHYQQPARGIRKSSPDVVTLVAATPLVLYQRTTGGQNPRTVIVRKMLAHNAGGADGTFEIGTGLGGAWGAIFPAFFIANGMTDVWTEDDIPEVEIGNDLTLQSTPAGIHVQVEVEEIE